MARGIFESAPRFFWLLEWVAHSKVKAEAFAEVGEIVVTMLAGVVGSMDGNAHIDA